MGRSPVHRAQGCRTVPLVVPLAGGLVGRLFIQRDSACPIIGRSVDLVEAAVRLDPQWSATRYNLGLAYVRQRRYEEAEAQWQRALALNPHAPHIHNSLSRLFIERGQFAALQQDPDFLLALGNRAWALEGVGRLEEAAAGYERVLEKNPGFSDLRFRLDRLRERLALERAR